MESQRKIDNCKKKSECIFKKAKMEMGSYRLRTCKKKKWKKKETEKKPERVWENSEGMGLKRPVEGKKKRRQKTKVGRRGLFLYNISTDIYI